MTGFKKFVDGMGIRMDETIAFGEFDTDAAMLAEVCLGVVVENACDLAKQKTDIIVGSSAKNKPAGFLIRLISQQ